MQWVPGVFNVPGCKLTSQNFLMCLYRHASPPPYCEPRMSPQLSPGPVFRNLNCESGQTFDNHNRRLADEKAEHWSLPSAGILAFHCPTTLGHSPRDSPGKMSCVCQAGGSKRVTRLTA